MKHVKITATLYALIDEETLAHYKNWDCEAIEALMWADTSVVQIDELNDQQVEDLKGKVHFEDWCHDEEGCAE